jgi:hypothetical protein
LSPTATETQGDHSKGAEDEETARMFKLEFHQKELDKCSIYMRRLIVRNNFNTNTDSYEGFSDQYVPDILEQVPYHQDKNPTEETRRPQDQLGSTGPEALAKTGPQGLPFQSHKTFTSFQDARIQDAPEDMGKCSSHK